MFPVTTLDYFFQAKKTITELSSDFSWESLLGSKDEDKKPKKDIGKKVLFEDVIGIDEFKEELVEIVDYLKNPKKYEDLGATVPKGILLCGNPGTGKTMLAQALANEADCSFFYKSGSEFDQIFVGSGARNIRDLFKRARKSQPAIIFIDEIDTIGGKR